MKFFLLASFALVCAASTVIGTGNIAVNDDGNYVITSPSGRQVTIQGPTGVSGQRYYQLTVTGPNVPTTTVQVSENSVSQANVVAEIIREYQGAVNEAQYQRFLTRINSVSPQFYRFLQNLDQQFFGQDAQQYVQQYGQQYRQQYGQQYEQQYGQQYGPYAQQYYGPYAQQYNGQYAQQYYGPYAQQYNGQYAQQYNGPYAQQYQQQYGTGYQYPSTFNSQYFGNSRYVNALLERVFGNGQNFPGLLAYQQYSSEPQNFFSRYFSRYQQYPYGQYFRQYNEVPQTAQQQVEQYFRQYNEVPQTVQQQVEQVNQVQQAFEQPAEYQQEQQQQGVQGAVQQTVSQFTGARYPYGQQYNVPSYVRQYGRNYPFYYNQQPFYRYGQGSYYQNTVPQAQLVY